jgi:hypothetical protein
LNFFLFFKFIFFSYTFFFERRHLLRNVQIFYISMYGFIVSRLDRLFLAPERRCFTHRRKNVQCPSHILAFLIPISTEYIFYYNFASDICKKNLFSFSQGKSMWHNRTKTIRIIHKKKSSSFLRDIPIGEKRMK